MSKTKHKCVAKGLRAYDVETETWHFKYNKNKEYMYHCEKKFVKFHGLIINLTYLEKFDLRECELIFTFSNSETLMNFDSKEASKFAFDSFWE